MTCGYADMFIILVFQLFPSYFNTMGEPNLHVSLKITEIISINSPTFSNYKLLIFKHMLGIFKSIYVDILLHTFVHKNSDAFHSKYVFNYLTLESNYIKVIPLICKHENPSFSSVHQYRKGEHVCMHLKPGHWELRKRILGIHLLYYFSQEGTFLFQRQNPITKK